MRVMVTFPAMETHRTEPTIALLRGHFDSIREAELQRHRGRFGGLNAAQQEAIEALTHNLVNELLTALMDSLHNADDQNRKIMIKTLHRLFNLGESSSSRLFRKPAVSFFPQQTKSGAL